MAFKRCGQLREVCVRVATHSLFFFFWSVHARSADPAAAAPAVRLLLIIVSIVLSVFYPKRVFDFIVFGGDNFKCEDNIKLAFTRFHKRMYLVLRFAVGSGYRLFCSRYEYS